MTMREVIDFISRFAAVSDVPVRTNTTVTCVRRTDTGYDVTTTNGNLRCRAVVLASGACNVPSVPSLCQAVPPSIQSFTPFSYRNPNDLPEGGVLIVGASATGVQLADEIRRSGRSVTLSVGEHVRLPRTYRGRDVLWWMDRSGVWDQRYDEIDDVTRVRRLPSPQLIGTPQRTTLESQRARFGRRRDYRPASRRAGRSGIVLGRTAKSVCPGRLEDEPFAWNVR
jgi:putative flavoprotein involved in K+ transport